MKCWICNARGDSREHLLKASDIDLYFPNLNQKNNAYIHKVGRINTSIGSKRSIHLTSSALICKNCNNNLTQPYDRAWENLSTYIDKNRPLIFSQNKINLKKVFPGCSNKSCLFFHLYFLKIFGCLLNDTEVGLGYIELSKEITYSILHRVAHSDIYIEIVKLEKEIIGVSDLNVSGFEGKLARAQWCYCVKDLCIRVYYLKKEHCMMEASLGWNPENNSKFIKLVNKMPTVKFLGLSSSSISEKM